MDVNQEVEKLRARIQEMETENSGLREQNERLNVELNEFKGAKNQPPRGGGDAGIDATPLNEADATLRRLVQRIAMILQAEKIVIMFHDRELGELIGIPPAYGVEESTVSRFRVRATQGISGEVFRTGEPVIFHDAVQDERTEKDHVVMLGVHNGVTVPLVIEKRDEEQRVVERNVIGVLHAFNKRHGEDFIDEDVHLLERMAKNVGSIIANLQLYREVVEEREELLQTFESLTAGLILVSPEGRISQMNGSARAIFALGNDVIGKQYREVLPYDKLQNLVTAVQAGQDMPTIELDIEVQKNDRVYQVQAAKVQGEDGKEVGVVAIFGDVTEIKNIERMKSSFVAMASHELRTPLTAIKGFSSTLLEGIDDEIYGPDEQKEFLGIVVHECDRLRRLIDDLLNTSRIEAGESLKPNYTEVSLPDLLKKVQMVQQQATNKHVLKLDVQGELPNLITADQDKLDQILTNLLNNAIKYSPGGGDITIHARMDTPEFVLMGVEDQGLGIPADHVNKVFERFHRVNNEDNRKIYGTGLGLFLVKHLVEQVHMGKVWCESTVGVGSTFWVRIPVALDVEEAKAINN
ncbi:MAG: GAF domain-containing protein [Armatimonadetes bacterium]|nr:GAF domain-containing protein [Armatimonadota bacterium]